MSSKLGQANRSSKKGDALTSSGTQDDCVQQEGGASHRRSVLRPGAQEGSDRRRNHLAKLYLKQRTRKRLLQSMVLPRRRDRGAPLVEEDVEKNLREEENRDLMKSVDIDESLIKEIEDEVEAEMDLSKSSKIVEMLELLKKISPSANFQPFNNAVEVRLENVSYSATLNETQSKIATVYNSSFLYPLYKWAKRIKRGEKKPEPKSYEFKVLDSVSLCLEPGKNYLVLGPPASGKTSLLKAISGRLRARGPNESVSGKILYNGRQLEVDKVLPRVKEWYIENAVAYIDQLDKHAPRLTVEETFDFSFHCKTGGTLKYSQTKSALSNPKAAEVIERCDKEGLGIQLVISALGLSDVKETFVGDTNVRGLSGGQRRRVTVGEMVTSRQPVLCGDEISTGLDAASTFDMVEVLTYFGKLGKMTRVFSLLQPTPDTVSLFDEVIVMGQGRILYAGPIPEVESYFADLGYKSPQFMDVADFLQTVSTPNGKELYDPDDKDASPVAPTIPELAEMFQISTHGKRISERLKESPSFVWNESDSNSNNVSGLAMSQQVRRKYANSFLRSCLLNLQRFFTLWTRDRRVIIAGAVKNILMGVSVGGVFSNVEDEVSILGALFQSGLFIMLGAMQNASTLVNDRVIFYKQMDANFFSSWPYIFGRTLASFPQTVLDVFMFGTILFFMVGLSDRDTEHFFIFISILITFALMMNMQLAVFASFASEATLQVYSACILLLLILFGGFIVAPAAIPKFYLFIYWWNPFAWAYRALVINEFRSERYVDPEETMRSIGFTYGKNADPFEQRWLGFCFVYMVFYFFACFTLTAIGLGRVRQTGEPTPPDAGVQRHRKQRQESDTERVIVDFKRVDLSFLNVCYEVKASTTDDTLKLLKEVSGVFRSGRMCALMGSSGAGKTTLMDVIALRKRTGTVTGDVRMNGWPQETISFRRSSGYVFQFDVQTPELTVKETVQFSARLRHENEVFQNEEELDTFVDQILKDVELLELSDSLVGTDDGIGLSFEQKKRLSIAVELAAAPSVMFLDEPTSGLDARSALIVAHALRKIADKGQTIVATIHQPSSAIFEMFDDLLLLKKGGEVVYHGELGSNCESLVRHFEGLGATKIELGENPANWMLRVITSDSLGDLAAKYRESERFHALHEELEQLKVATPDRSQKIEYENEFAASRHKRRLLVLGRLRLIYWRSPAYNLSRIMVSLVIAFVLGSVFILKRHQKSYTEVEMRSRFSVMFLTFIITGIMAILSVIPVMLRIREMFYRHRDAGMYDSASIGLALGGAEKFFILMSGAVFSVVFLGVAGMSENLKSLVGFFGYFTFNVAIYSYIGQAFACAVENQTTALILSSVFVGLNNFFSGLIVLPQLMNSGFFAVPYYITPGHYVFEGMVTSLFWDDEKQVVADQGGDFYLQLQEAGQCTDVCIGSVRQFVVYFFDNNFVPDHTIRNTLILGLVLVLSRVMTYVALKYVRFN